MIPRLRGRAGSTDAQDHVQGGKGMRGSWTRGAVVVLVFAVVVGGACKHRGPKPGEEGGGTGAGLGEEGLGGRSGSSLDRAQRGLAPEEGGILGDVHFAYDSSEIDSAAREI